MLIDEIIQKATQRLTTEELEQLVCALSENRSETITKFDGALHNRVRDWFEEVHKYHKVMEATSCTTYNPMRLEEWGQQLLLFSKEQIIEALEKVNALPGGNKLASEILDSIAEKIAAADYEYILRNSNMSFSS